jgi:hypothetical protein
VQSGERVGRSAMKSGRLKTYNFASWKLPVIKLTFSAVHADAVSLSDP